MANREWRNAEPAHPEWDHWLRRLQAGADPFTLLDEVLEWVRKHTAAQTALLLLTTPIPTWSSQKSVPLGAARNLNEVDFMLVSGQGAEELRGLRLRSEETVLDELLQKRLPWHYHDESEQEPHSRGVRRGFKGLRSALGVPLPGLPGGALVLVNRREQEPFTPSDEALLQMIAPLFTIGVYLHTLKQTLEWHEHELGWLHQLPDQLREELSLQRVLQVMEPMLRAASPLTGGIWLYDEERTRLLCTLHYGTPTLPERIDPSTLPADWQHTPFTLTTEQGLNLMLFPLRLAGRTLGVLMSALPSWESAGVEDSGQPNATHRLPLATLTGHIALLVGYALLQEQLATRHALFTTLYEFSLHLSEVRTVEEWLALLAQNAIRLVPTDYCVIYFASGSARLQPVWVTPPEHALLNHYPDAQYSLPGWVCAFNAPLAAPDLARHPQNLKEPLPGHFQSALAVPLQTAEQAFGTLLLLTTAPREFTLAEVEALFMLANFGALHLQHLGSHAST